MEAARKENERLREELATAKLEGLKRLEVAIASARKENELLKKEQQCKVLAHRILCQQ